MIGTRKMKKLKTYPLKVQKIHKDAKLPAYAKEGDSGMDISICEDYNLKPREIKALKTGLKFEIPEGFELQVRPRSGVSLKTQLRITNSPGTCDFGYRSELLIIVENTSNSEYIKLASGYRIAQIVLSPVYIANVIEVDSINEDTERGNSGFGSTGTN